ncbi:MAG TPA: HAMP domain-containing sensor histidine kinase, partial [Aggregatilineales bacterium]|nr:HAMP domain-containing sensor histidine kinase [Aggregatilineales bacterium]
LKSERAVATPLRELPLPPRIRDALLRPLASDEEEKTFQVTLDNDHVIAVLISAVINDSPMIDTPKQDGWVIVLQDVTHIKQAEIARAQFMQAAAHDMRNPLSVTYSSIITLNKLLTHKDPAVEEIIHLALGGLDRLRTLIDDLLHLEHIESGYGFKLTEFSLLDVLHEVSKESFMLMVDKAITLTLDVQPDIPMIKADVRWFKRALHNYLGNATKYTQKGGAVKLRVYTKNDFLHVEVIDNGPGIPLSAHAHLFERFYRVDGNKAEGSGLGLAIVKSVAIAHGGDVYLRSKPGEGTTFGFTMPLNPPEK